MPTIADIATLDLLDNYMPGLITALSHAFSESTPLPIPLDFANAAQITETIP